MPLTPHPPTPNTFFFLFEHKYGNKKSMLSGLNFLIGRRHLKIWFKFNLLFSPSWIELCFLLAFEVKTTTTKKQQWGDWEKYVFNLFYEELLCFFWMKGKLPGKNLRRAIWNLICFHPRLLGKSWIRVLIVWGQEGQRGPRWPLKGHMGRICWLCFSLFLLLKPPGPRYPGVAHPDSIFRRHFHCPIDQVLLGPLACKLTQHSTVLPFLA